METDDDLDTHICLSCQLPIIGLDNYVFHKKHECSAKKRKHSQAANLPQPVSNAFSQVTSAHGDIQGADGTALQVITVNKFARLWLLRAVSFKLFASLYRKTYNETCYIHIFLSLCRIHLCYHYRSHRHSFHLPYVKQWICSSHLLLVRQWHCWQKH